MTTRYTRREALTRMWQWSVGLVAVAGAWTAWDVLKPANAAQVGPVRTVHLEDVPDVGVLEVAAMSGYLTKVDDEVVALWWRCPHLGCKVPWCDSSGQFECPCHGSVFNRVGEYRRGPSPRGMDSYPYTVEEGVIVVDTGAVIEGDPPGNETLDEPPLGPDCLETTEEA
ncbi:MAG: Rieske 2Fe-2S domain-containing protein [Acidobacteria bacterium]|nr:Rieske 2Fe-2S domain-containing protein [Acidobacteriota bacterium]